MVQRPIKLQVMQLFAADTLTTSVSKDFKPVQTSAYHLQMFTFDVQTQQPSNLSHIVGLLVYNLVSCKYSLYSSPFR